MEPQYIVRYYDAFDGWMDIFGPDTKEEVQRKYDMYTEGGTRATRTKKAAMGEYYEIFDANTKMMITPESLGR